MARWCQRLNSVTNPAPIHAGATPCRCRRATSGVASVDCQKAEGPSKYEFEGPSTERSKVTSSSSRTSRQIPTASSPAAAASCLAGWILGFRPIPLSLAGLRRRFLSRLRAAAQPLCSKENQKFLLSPGCPQKGRPVVHRSRRIPTGFIHRYIHSGASEQNTGRNGLERCWQAGSAQPPTVLSFDAGS